FADLALEYWRATGTTGNDTVAISEQPTPVGTPAMREGTPSTTATPAEGPTPGKTTPSPSPTVAAPAAKAALSPSTAFSAPTDTRIVVNAPSHRMDVFQD